MSVKLPSIQKTALWNDLRALLLHNTNFRTFLQLIPRKTILPPNFRSSSNGIGIARKHTEIRHNLHILVTLTLFVRVRILLRLPTKKQFFFGKAAFFITFCKFQNFQIFDVCQMSVKRFFEAVKRPALCPKVLTSLSYYTFAPIEKRNRRDTSMTYRAGSFQLGMSFRSSILRHTFPRMIPSADGLRSP